MIYIEFIERDRTMPIEIFRQLGNQGSAWADGAEDRMILQLGRTMRIGPAPSYFCLWEIPDLGRLDAWGSLFSFPGGRQKQPQPSHAPRHPHPESGYLRYSGPGRLARRAAVCRGIRGSLGNCGKRNACSLCPSRAAAWQFTAASCVAPDRAGWSRPGSVLLLGSPQLCRRRTLAEGPPTAWNAASRRRHLSRLRR
jgi:hypothetical protein